MGASGGVKIFQVEELKSKWNIVKQELVNLVGINFRNADKYEANIIKDLLQRCDYLPNRISDKNYQEITNMLQIFGNYNTPFLYNDTIIITYGNNVTSECAILSEAINKIEHVKIQTWS